MFLSWNHYMNSTEQHIESYQATKSIIINSIRSMDGIDGLTVSIAMLHWIYNDFI